jgi:hypothetical protein
LLCSATRNDFELCRFPANCNSCHPSKVPSIQSVCPSRKLVCASMTIRHARWFAQAAPNAADYDNGPAKNKNIDRFVGKSTVSSLSVTKGGVTVRIIKTVGEPVEVTPGHECTKLQQLNGAGDQRAVSRRRFRRRFRFSLFPRHFVEIQVLFGRSTDGRMGDRGKRRRLSCITGGPSRGTPLSWASLATVNSVSGPIRDQRREYQKRRLRLRLFRQLLVVSRRARKC